MARLYHPPYCLHHRPSFCRHLLLVVVEGEQDRWRHRRGRSPPTPTHSPRCHFRLHFPLTLNPSVNVTVVVTVNVTVVVTGNVTHCSSTTPTPTTRLVTAEASAPTKRAGHVRNRACYPRHCARCGRVVLRFLLLS